METQSLHPLLPFVTALVAGSILWTVILFLVSRAGWSQLASVYRCRRELPKKPVCRAQVGTNFASYGSVGVYVDDEGFYLRTFPMVRMWHPPLFFPWRSIHAQSGRWAFFFPCVNLTFDGVEGVVVRLYRRKADRIAAAAGPNWPTVALP
jgi:hypothetical protein